MSENWIKMRTNLSRTPEVFQIAGETGLDRFAVVGRLHEIWSWFDEMTEDGNAAGVTFVTVNSLVGNDNFAQAMHNVGWLDENDGVLIAPHFDKHNGQTARKRANTARRVATHRAKKTCNADSVTKRKSKRKNTHSSECVAPAHTEAFFAEAARFVSQNLNSGIDRYTSVSVVRSWLKQLGETNPTAEWQQELTAFANHALPSAELFGWEPKGAESRTNGAPEREAVLAYAESEFIPRDFADRFWNYYEACDWNSRSFNPLKWRQKLKEWFLKDGVKGTAKPVDRKKKAPMLDFDDLDRAFLKMQGTDPDVFLRPKVDWPASDEGALTSLMMWRRTEKQNGLPK